MKLFLPIGLSTFLLFFLFSCKSTLQLQPYRNTTSTYNYEVDLTQMKGDKLKVNLLLTGIAEETLSYCFPKIVPGIYGAMDFGKYISDLQAYDEKGSALTVKKSGVNCWEIAGARNIRNLTYVVDDTWEVFDFEMEEGFYKSASSSFGPKSLVLNNNCVFGYIKGYEQTPINISVGKPTTYYAATSLKKQSPKEGVDVFTAASYHELVDNPILYARPDTTLLKFEDIEVEVACYSSSGRKISREIAEHIRPLIENQRAYLGGKLPVSRYTFLLYHNLNPDQNSYMGDGLEHSHSTLILFYMPMDLKIIKENVYGIASHEFFHTLMPLGIHSHEIANYNFNDPKFSRHLWLYEGMTEYFTLHMPIKQNVQKLEDFLREVQKKIKDSKGFDPNLSLTELSMNPMDKQDQYYNVYLKGALVNLCMDIELREHSQGAYGVQNLVADLLAKYGPHKSFEDDAFFEEVIQLTGHEGLREFIDSYIKGTQPLPLKAYLAKVGLDLHEGKGIISVNESLTKDQKALREAWIGQ